MPEWRDRWGVFGVEMESTRGSPSPVIMESLVQTHTIWGLFPLLQKGTIGVDYRTGRVTGPVSVTVPAVPVTVTV